MKTFIKNRHDKKIAVAVKQSLDQKGLAFVMHGLGGTKEQPQIIAAAQSFFENGYSTICFDARNTFGESEGNYEDANTTNYLEDLEDVIDWASKQKWYTEPFILFGTSLGGLCVLLYAEKRPKKVKAIFTKGTVISGKLSLQTYPKEEMEEWERTGWKIVKSGTIPGLIKKLKWNQFIQDELKYDALKDVKNLTMPVFVIYGSEDRQHEPHSKILFDALPGLKYLQIIKGAPHTFREPQHLAELKDVVNMLLKEIK